MDPNFEINNIAHQVLQTRASPMRHQARTRSIAVKETMFQSYEYL